MLKHFLTAVVLVAFLSPSVAMSATPERDLLFHVSFDRMSVNADYAKGKASSIDFKSDLEFRPYEGFDHKNAFLRQGHETLSYDAIKNFNPLEGTMSVWIKPVNWDPAGEGLKPLGHKHFLSVRFKNPNGNAMMSLYKYYTQDDIAFLITTSLNKKNWLIRAPGSLYKKGQWIQLASTWGNGKMAYYINGQKVGSGAYESAYSDVAKAGVQSGKILINPILWGGKNEPWNNQTAVDDVKIYGRALSAAEIARNYAALSGNVVDMAQIPPVHIVGLDRDDGRLDRMMAEIDLNILDASWINAIAAGKVQVTSRLAYKGETVFEQKDQPRNPQWRLFLENANEAGKYDFSLDLKNTATGQTHRITTTVEKPNLSFYGNTFGKEDFVPEPWTPIQIKGNRVTVWNRTYQFDGPFIHQVTSGDQDILAEGVTLMADTGDGLKPIVFSEPKVTQTRQDEVVFTGEGELGDLTVTFINTVWFDGFSRVEFTVGPEKQTLKQLQITYKVKPEFSKFHTMAKWRPFEEGGNHYAFNRTQWRGFSQLWLMGDTHGFCWVPENEGNWVNAPDAKPIHLYKEDSGARVVLDLITEQVAIPQNLTYSFGFIATPTRPLPDNFRTFTTAGWNLKNSRARIVGWGGKGFTSYASLIPATKKMNLKGPTFNEYLKTVWSKKDSVCFAYSSPTSLSSHEVLPLFYKDTWEIPGSSSFPITDVRGYQYHQFFASETRIMRDYFINLVENLLSRRDKEIGGVYYDLCFVMSVRNPYAPTVGAFTDAFGRKIPSRLNTLELRELLMRTLKICRKYGKHAWYHGHVVYNPAVMGLGDYWYPGEHLASELGNNRYYYADEMPQEQYETDFNAHQKGVGVINLPVIGRLYRKRNNEPKPTESMLGMMMLNDVISSATQAHLPTIDKMWGIRIKHELDKAKFVRFNQNNDFKSSNDKIVSSFFKFPNGKLFAILVNRSVGNQRATVSFAGNYKTANEEWKDKPLKLTNGNTLDITIPGRMFRLVVLEPGKAN